MITVMNSEHGRRIGLPENDSQAIDTRVLIFQTSTTVSPYEVDIFGNFIVCNHDKRCEKRDYGTINGRYNADGLIHIRTLAQGSRESSQHRGE